MLKTKKAQGLSLDMIVVGAIGLVVLVVIISIFVSSAQKSQKDIDAKQKGSDCSTLFTTDATYSSAITYPSNCTMAGGEILIGKYYGKPKELIPAGRSGFTTKVISTEIVDADGMSYVCCKYKIA